MNTNKREPSLAEVCREILLTPYTLDVLCERCGKRAVDFVYDERAGNMVCQSCYWAQEAEREVEHDRAARLRLSVAADLQSVRLGVGDMSSQIMSHNYSDRAALLAE